MKIMIVDDESIIRTGLTTVIDWKELGLRLLPAASSAEEAWERIPIEKPHIVLTDIRMYEMSGIELAGEVKKLLPDTEVIILTGYDDFTYAQQALRENVTDYLLKTSPPEEIIQAVLKARQRIVAKWEAQKQESAKISALRKQLLGQLLTGLPPASDSDEPLIAWMKERNVLRSCDEPPYGAPLRVIVLTATGWGDELSELLLGAVENMLNELLDMVGMLQDDKIVIITPASATITNYDRFEHAIQLAEQTLKCTIFAAVGRTVQTPAELALSYDMAIHIFTYRHLLDQRGIHRIDTIQRRHGGRTVCSQAEEAELAGILLENNALRLRQWVNRLIEEKRLHPESTPETYAAFAQSMIIAGYRWLERVKGVHSIATNVDRCVHPPSVQAEPDVYRQLASVMNAYHEEIASGPQAYVTKAMGYIRTHLDENITMQDVAEFVHLHPSHFSEMFKKEAGMAYIEFVTQERMQLAMHYLKTTEMKISEIAGKVGYRDIKYFGQQFKKHTGKTPSEYQQSG